MSAMSHRYQIDKPLNRREGPEKGNYLSPNLVEMAAMAAMAYVS
jgi:hypothetical protein